MKKVNLIIFLGVIIVLSGGCRTLREKFVRQPSQKEVPVYVDFKDYGETPTRQVYLDYHLYARGWLDELVKALNRGVSHKRQRYAIAEALMNIEQIISFFNQEGKDKIAPLYQELQEVQAEI